MSNPILATGVHGSGAPMAVATNPTSGGTVDIATNPTNGGSSGKAFDLTNGLNAATKVTVWVKKGSGGWNDRDLIKGIEVSWASKTLSAKGDTKDAMEYSFAFNDGEKVTAMDLWTGDRVDKISLPTDIISSSTNQPRTWTHGGTGGSKHSQVLANGILLGFKGTYDSNELVSIGSVFKEDSD